MKSLDPKRQDAKLRRTTYTRLSPGMMTTLGLVAAVLVVVLIGWGVSFLRGAGSGIHDFEMVLYNRAGVADGTTVSFKDLLDGGKPVVLNFWAGDCPPCRAEMPAFQETYEAHESAVDFIGVDVGVFTGLGTRQSALQLLEELNITYPTGAATDRTSLVSYSITAMPTTIFFDASGKVFRRWDGFISKSQMEAILREIVP